MTAQYRLPDWLGGGTYAAVGNHHDDHGESLIKLDVPDVGVVRMPSRLLTEMLSEPPNGSVYSTGDGLTLSRCDSDIDPVGAWYLTGDKAILRWGFVAPMLAQPGWRRYVPDPADDAPALPWGRGVSRGHEFIVYQPSPQGTIQLALGDSCEDYAIEEAERIAVAILGGVRAAREVEQP